MKNKHFGNLKNKIIDTLNLVDVTPEDIEDDAPLVGGNLGIDSIDILELVMMIEKDYGVRIDSKEQGQQVFSNLKALGEHIWNNMPESDRQAS